MTGIADGVTRWVERLMALSLAVMVVLTFANVVLRYVFNSGYAGAEEISRLAFVWLIFLGTVIAHKRNEHLGMTMVQKKLSPMLRRVCAVICHVAMLYGIWLFASGSWTQIKVGAKQIAPVTGYSMALMPLAGFVCAIVLFLLVILNLVRIFIASPKAYVPGEGEEDLFQET
ncbi:TRAP transporter small permease [Lacibacterium aquatile]|uniref:TRAP transporter small permease protein n=1 Tax=Lacibacterium aquatile TaxID=1168082 RepID=A0ABW5DMS1_9PROT